MRITVVDVLKCGFFSTLKTDKLPNPIRIFATVRLEVA